jgi:hypothetical protein
MATPISLRLPDELDELLRRRAKAEHRSLNAQIITILEGSLGLRRASAIQSSGKKTYKPDPRPGKKK